MATKHTRLNKLRGTGQGSRMVVSVGDLPEGWRFERRSDKFCVWFDDRGNRYKSAAQVEVASRERDFLRSEMTSETETETSASEYELSPLKKPRLPDQPGPR